MGALRAAELHEFGMTGVGAVFTAYRDSEIEADDEVALLHSTSDEDYQPLSETLVAMRATFAAAARLGVCDPAEASALVRALSRRHFSQRSYGALPKLAPSVGMTVARAEEIKRFCVTHPQDPKREDALALVDLMTNMPDTDEASRLMPEPCALTTHLYMWELAAEGRTPEDRGPRSADIHNLRVLQLLEPDYPRLHESLVLENIVAECRQRCGRQENASNSDTAEAALRHGMHRGFYRWPAVKSELPFLQQWTTVAERGRLSAREQLLRFLIRSYRWSPGTPPDRMALARARVLPSWSNAVYVNNLAWEMNDRITSLRDGLRLAAINKDLVLEMFATRWHTSGDDLALAALDRGIGTIENLIALARPFYLLLRYDKNAAERFPALV
ncbi:hypothetical protein Acsp02_95330 [Actinoplanes sp. NBRC 103695]|nr:hypothetical protein Acsp02_95330 [Actinoplanes sp. NBRC 103695]